jgi:hypothetical protein
MPQIIVTAGSEHGFDERTVMLRERVNATDFESDRFTANLLERLGWAVEDATSVEDASSVEEATGERERDLPAPTELHRRDPRPHRDPEPAGIA